MRLTRRRNSSFAAGCMIRHEYICQPVFRGSQLFCWCGLHSGDTSASVIEYPPEPPETDRVLRDLSNEYETTMIQKKWRAPNTTRVISRPQPSNTSILALFTLVSLVFPKKRRYRNAMLTWFLDRRVGFLIGTG
jgi:hypothetical protein